MHQEVIDGFSQSIRSELFRRLSVSGEFTDLEGFENFVYAVDDLDLFDADVDMFDRLVTQAMDRLDDVDIARHCAIFRKCLFDNQLL